MRCVIAAVAAALAGVSCAAPRATGGDDADASVALLRAEIGRVRAAMIDAESKAAAGGDADASVAALRAQLRDVQAGMVAMRNELHAGRDVNTNDAWTLRLLGCGVLLLGLSYPVGKLVWLAALGLGRRARGTPYLADVRDYLLMKEKSAGLVTRSGQRPQNAHGPDLRSA